MAQGNGEPGTLRRFGYRSGILAAMDNRSFSDVGGTPGGLGPFLLGFVMACVGGYLLSNQVSVVGSYWSFYGANTFGITLVPLLFGVAILFWNGSSKIGWLLTIAGVLFILAGVIGSSRAGEASVIYFILIYIFSNLGAFGVVALISAQTGRESLNDYRGLYANNKALSWVMAISLFSLAGIPPTAGFFGKFFLLLAGAGKGNYVFIGIAALNMVVSLYYYLKVIKAIFMDRQEQPVGRLKIPLLPNIAFVVCVAGIMVTGLVGWVYDYIYSLSSGF